jgi:hypothetical protein
MNPPRYLFPLRPRSDLPLLGFVIGTGISFLLWLCLASALWWFTR